jgi:hypothetical protein
MPKKSAFTDFVRSITPSRFPATVPTCLTMLVHARTTLTFPVRPKLTLPSRTFSMLAFVVPACYLKTFVGELLA